MMEFFRVLATSLGTSVRTVLAQLRGRGSEGDDDNAEAYDDAEVITPIGFASRPVASSKLEAVVYRLGDEAIVLAIIDKSMPAMTSADVDAGEAIMYGPAQPTAVIKIDKNGAISITSKSGQAINITATGSNVVLNGGVTAVAKEGSQTAGHTHTFTGTVAGAACSGTTAPATDTINAGQGSPHILVP